MNRGGGAPATVMHMANTTTQHSFLELAEKWYAEVGQQKREFRNHRSMLNKHLLPAFGILPVTGVTREPVQRWRDGFSGSEATQRHILQLLQQILQYGVAMGWLEFLPYIPKPKQVHKPQKPFLIAGRRLTEEDIEKIYLTPVKVFRFRYYVKNMSEEQAAMLPVTEEERKVVA